MLNNYKGLKLNGAHQPFACADEVNIVGDIGYGTEEHRSSIRR
jgi:hypothetical protein